MTAHVSTRSYLTAGIAALGATAIAIGPVQPLSQHASLAPQQVNNLAVGLVSSIDPITPWIDTIQNTADNIVGLFDAWASAPFPIVTQVINNQFTYLSELPNIGTIISQVIGNFGNAIMAPWVADPSTLDTTVTPGFLPHSMIWEFLHQIIDIPAIVQPVLDFTTTYTSGILIGLVGPVVAPVLALANSAMSIVNKLVGLDLIGALNDVINIPAAVTNAFLNGGPTLEFNPLMDLIGLKIPNLARVGLTMGGLLSPGGSLFNAFDLDVSFTIPPLPPIDAGVHGVPTGAIGSLIGLTNAVANSIAVTPPNSAAAKAAASSEAAAPEVSAADVAPQASAGDNSAPKPSGRASKAGRGTDNGAAAGSDAPARSGKGGASRAA